MALMEATLVKRWKSIESVRGPLSDRTRVKRKWFSASFAFLESLPWNEHWWCCHRHVVWQLLLTIKQPPRLLQPLKFRRRLLTRIQKCTACLIAYHQAIKFIRSEYENVTAAYVKYLSSHDSERITLHLDGLLASQNQALTEEDLSVLHELLLFPELLRDDRIMDKFVQFIQGAGAVSLSKSHFYPGIYELLFHADPGVRKFAMEQAVLLGTIRSLDGIQPLLEERIPLLQSSDGTVVSDTIWGGFGSLFTLLEKQTLRDCFERYPTLPNIILENIGVALSCFEHLLDVYGSSLWSKTSSLASSAFDVLASRVQEGNAVKIFEPFYQSLEPLEHESLQLQVLALLLSLSDDARQVALRIVCHRYTRDAPSPAWYYGHIWGPSVLSALHSTESECQSSLQLAGTVILADATALSALHALANGCESLANSENEMTWKCGRSWKCVPLVWKAMLEEATHKCSAFLRSFLSAASKLSLFTKSATEEACALRNAASVIDCSKNTEELIHLFRRYAVEFATRCHGRILVDWPWEPVLAGNLFLLLMDPNLSIRGLATDVVRLLAEKNGFSDGLDIMCSSDESRGYIVSSIKFATELLRTRAQELPSCLTQLFFTALQIMEHSTQQRSFVQQLSSCIWPLLTIVLTWELDEIRRVCGTEFAKMLPVLFELIIVHCNDDVKCSLQTWVQKGCCPTWFSELVSWNDFSLEVKISLCSAPYANDEPTPEPLQEIPLDDDIMVVEATPHDLVNIASDSDEHDTKARPHKRSASAAFGDEAASSSKRPAYSRLRELWYMKVLSLDFYSLEEPGDDLTEVPLFFRDHNHYIETFTPLLLEEFKADMQRVHENLNSLAVATATLASLGQRNTHHYVARFIIREGDKASFMKHDLVLLSKAPLQSASESTHAIAKVLHRGEGASLFSAQAEQFGLKGRPIFHLHLYLPPTVARLAETLGLLVEGSNWHFAKLVSSTPYYRQCQAMASVSSLPLAKSILAPGSCKFRTTYDESYFPMSLWHRLKEEFNESQFEAIQAAVGNNLQQTHKIALVQGPPGTGKTSTIVGIISALIQCAKKREPRKKAKVLVCAQSNAAVDEVVTRILKQGLYDFMGKSYRPYMVRVGPAKMVHANSMAVHLDRLVERRKASANGHDLDSLRTQLDNNMNEMLLLKDHCYKLSEQKKGGNNSQIIEILNDMQQQQKFLFEELLNGYEMEEYEALPHDERKRLRNEIYREAEVVLTTLNTCGGDLHAVCMDQRDLIFDAVVIDEAAQALEPATLIPLQLLRGKHGRCIMVGDPNQLPATVLSQSASNMQFQLSMFERFQRNGFPVTMLKTQYRMHPEIRRFPSLHFYEDQLKDGDVVLGANRYAQYHKERLFGPYMFFDVSDGKESRDRSLQSLRNPEEANVAVEMFRALKHRYKLRPFQVGVISPYRQQCKLIQERFYHEFGSNLPEVEFGTVDGFQGREVDIVILSTVRVSSSRGASIGFVADIRRMNVALTRARFSLWIIGNARTLEVNPAWAALIKDAKQRQLLTTIVKPYARNFAPGD